MSKKIISFFLIIMLFTTSVFSCYGEVAENENLLTQVFIRQEIFKDYSLVYDTFKAAITLENGTEITGIGYTDYTSYYESEDGKSGFFPAGFIADYGYEIPIEEKEKGLMIENLDFTDNQCLFVYDYETKPFMCHCVKNGQYLKYGVNDYGAITYQTSTYKRGECDEDLGALYSYDLNRYVFDPDVGNYIKLDGVSLFDSIDFAEMEAQINQIIADQNNRFSEQEIISCTHIAQEAIVSYLLSLQEETFLGYRVADLIDYASQLDPMECVRITPDGLVVIQIEDEIPERPDNLTKWLVGIGCLMVVAGSTALTIFFPVARPLSGAITGAAFDIFMQVVIENKTLENIQWGKVAVSAVSGATMAWLCPLAASSVTKSVTQSLVKNGLEKGLGKALGKLAGYGVQTISNSLVSGMTGYVNDRIDGKDGWDAFKSGVLIGGGCTIIASVLAEAGPKLTKILTNTKTGQWINKTLAGINPHSNLKQYHLKNQTLENILNPKSVHMAAENAILELNGEAGVLGGRYDKLTTAGDGAVDRHEIPSNKAFNQAMGTEEAKRDILPAIKMSEEDHMLTASFGRSNAADEYRKMQAKLIANGDKLAALQMDIDDITSKFGSKYNDGIKQALDYAINVLGW